MSEFETFESPEYYESDDDKNVDIMIQNINKEILLKVLTFLGNENLKYTSRCEEVQFNDDNDAYFYKHLRHLIRTHSSLPISMKPYIKEVIDDIEVEIELNGERKHFNTHILRKAQSMKYH